MSNEITVIDVNEANRRAGSGALLLDVREADEWDAGHAPAATHLPLAVCRSGNRSGRATEALVAAGYDVVNMAGGMKEWAAAGLPVVTDGGTPGTVI